MTAAFEQLASGDSLTPLLFELDALGLLVLAAAVAIFLIRYSAGRG